MLNVENFIKISQIYPCIFLKKFEKFCLIWHILSRCFHNLDDFPKFVEKLSSFCQVFLNISAKFGKFYHITTNFFKIFEDFAKCHLLSKNLKKVWNAKLYSKPIRMKICLQK